MSQGGASIPTRPMFNRLSKSYDLANPIISWGRDRKWKQAAIKAIATPRARWLFDCGAGTGDLSRGLATSGPTPRIVSVDASRLMMLSSKRPWPPNASRLEGDAQRVPLRDATMDGAVAGYLLRHLVDLPAWFQEMARVLRPGARMAILDIAYPRGRFRRRLFSTYFHSILPLMGGVLTRQRAAYDYLSRSLRTFSAPEQLATMGERAGFAVVSLRRSDWFGLLLLVFERREDGAHP